ncbi:MAG: hypothetical protein WCF14_11475 [Nitrososphaeraceae archaeon]
MAVVVIFIFNFTLIPSVYFLIYVVGVAVIPIVIKTIADKIAMSTPFDLFMLNPPF